MITHPEKVLFPEDGITKGDLASYYEAVAPLMLPHLRGRPVTMERYPSGIGRPGFLQKNVARGFPAWLERVEVEKKDGTLHHPLANDVRSLLWLANQNCITPHVWASRMPDLYHPDLCIFDLDPSQDDDGALQQAVLALRDVLSELGLASWVKTSGSKGFHVVLPLRRGTGFEEAAIFANGAGTLLVRRHSEVFTQEFLKADRGGRIFIDTGRNGYGATFAAPYGVRAKPGAPVSAPCTWQEVESGVATPRAFTLRNMPDRMARDPWADLYESAVSLAGPAAELRRLLGEQEYEEGARMGSGGRFGRRSRRARN